VEHRGRPKGQGVSKLDEHEAMLRQLLERNISKKWIAEQLGVSTASLWYWIKTRGIR
jgi:transcriptional regulator with PAS, ATPase and Fis domain